MLSSRRCPHTGIVNFFADAEPFLAVGSVTETREPALYHWRCYLGHEPVAGSAPDMQTAEIHLCSHYRELERAALLIGGDALGGMPTRGREELQSAADFSTAHATR
jgi:hypothetical protein